MKKRIVWFLIFIVIPVGILYALDAIAPVNKEGVRVDPGILNTIKDRWVVAGSTVSDGAEPTDLTVTERTYQTVDAAIIAAAGGDEKIIVYDIPRNWNALRMRCAAITDDGTITYSVYIGDLGDGNKHSNGTSADCELTYIGSFAWVVGTQVSTISTYEMADTLTYTANASLISVSTISPGTASERVAEAEFDVKGSDILVLVPTTVSCDAKLLVKGY
ncbi:MAG: hypothetical protein IMZ53_02155 [Thermoplasmata archaeon]|nr:hypothetical protein [Thermoplasmata archaeon]